VSFSFGDIVSIIALLYLQQVPELEKNMNPGVVGIPVSVVGRV
jgi:hypothetical protein